MSVGKGNQLLTKDMTRERDYQYVVDDDQARYGNWLIAEVMDGDMLIAVTVPTAWKMDGTHIPVPSEMNNAL